MTTNNKIMKKISQIILMLIIITTMFLPVFSVTFAHTASGQTNVNANIGAKSTAQNPGINVGGTTETKDYTVITPLPGIGDGDTGGKVNLTTYFSSAFNLIVGIAAALAFIYITVGGIIYATSDAISGKTDGRGYIENAVWGLLLVIGSWVILNTLNPQILNFSLVLPKPKVETSTGGVVAGECADCKNLKELNIPTSPGAGANPTLNTSQTNALIKLKNSLSGSTPPIGWAVSEAYPPTVPHADPCHSTGGCEDVILTGNRYNLSEIQSFFSAAKNSGISVIMYEVQSESDLKRILGNNVRIINNYAQDSKGNMYFVNTKTNGIHFHMR
jgi:hypothetical protein